MNKDSIIYVAGHKGLVGSSILKKLLESGYNNIVYKDSKDLDLRDLSCVEKFYQKYTPEYVFLAAAKVGGIGANITNPVGFLLDNLSIQNNVISSAHKFKVKKLLFLGSSCIYPRICPQPMKEEYLLDGKLEPTNEAYAIAKISGLKLCQYYKKQYNADFISAMPTNIYGINDNFNTETSHVIPSLINKIHRAKVKNENSVTVWGTGNARREFLFSDDLAEALIYLMNNYSEETHINIGVNYDVSILELANIIKEVIGYRGSFYFDISKPDGMPRKLLDVSRLHQTGWRHKTDLKEGIELTYKWFLNNYNEL